MAVLRVFVSYEAMDVDFATQLITDLQDSGAEVIIDRTDLHGAAFEQFLDDELSQCQQLIVVQTPEAVQSLRVQSIVAAAIEYVQQARMAGVLRVIAPTLDPAEVQTVPSIWAETPEFDARQDYPKALVRLRLKLDLPDPHNIAEAPLPLSYVPPISLSGLETVNDSSGSDLPSSQHLSSLDRPAGPLKHLSGSMRSQTPALLDRPARPLKYPFSPRRSQLLIISSIALVLILSVAGMAVFLQQRSTAGKSTPSNAVASIHLSTPTPKPTPTPTPKSIPTPTPTPVPQSPPQIQQPLPPAPTPQPTQPPPPQPTPRPTQPPAILSCVALSNDADCTGQDPLAQGCNGDAYTVSGAIYYIKNNNGTTIGEVDLRYSTICQSNWARAIVYNSCGYTNIFAVVKRPGQVYQGKTFGAAQQPFTINNPGCVSNYELYTNMVYAPAAVTAQACGSIQGFGGACTRLI